MRMNDWIRYRSKFYSDREFRIVDGRDNLLYTGGLEGLSEFKELKIVSMIDFEGVTTIRVE